MKRIVLFAVVAAFFLAVFGPHLRAADTPPNVVFLISDDLCWTDYGFMGHPQVETPHLDRLAARSALFFPRGYVPTALCRPALATFTNGLYAHQHGVIGNDPSAAPCRAWRKRQG